MKYNPSKPSQSIEPWLLTAYALSELDADDALRVEHALAKDPALRNEFEQIQQTLTSVRSALAKTSSDVKLNEKQTAVVTGQMKQIAAPNLSPNLPVKLAERPFYRRKRFAALLATAAAIPLAATWFYGMRNEMNFAVATSNGVNVAEGPIVKKQHKIKDMPIENSDLGKGNSELGDMYGDVATGDSDGDKGAMGSDSGMDGFGGQMGISLGYAGASMGGMSDDSYPGGMGGYPGGSGAGSTGEYSQGGYGGSSGMGSGMGMSGGGVRGGYDGGGYAGESKPSSGGDSGVTRGLGGMSDGGYGGGYGGGGGGYGGGGLSAGGKGGMGGNVVIEESRGSQPPVKRFYSTPSKKAGTQAGDDVNSLLKSQSHRFLVTEGEQSRPVDAYADAAAGGSSATGFAEGGGGYGAQPAPAVVGQTPYNLSTPNVLLRRSEGTYLAESLASHDKQLRDTDLPAELRQNAPHLFNEAKRVELGTDRFEKIVETPFVETQKAPLSTFSIDVDTASYSKIRQTLMEGNRLPSPSMVRIEEMINYFEYAYAGPQDERPFAAHMNVDRCPWNPEHQLVRIGLQAKKLDAQKRVNANIVFLLDVSGSMNEPNKLPLVKKSLAMLVNQLTENDRVAIVVYAGAAGCVLPSICGAEKQAILSSLDHLNAGGSTNGGQGIQLAYSIAKQHFIPGGANRVILCTDGDFNVGVTGDDALVAMMQENAKSNIFLTCLGFGAGNYNDTMMEKISNKGNGVYGMIDNELEGRRMMVEQLGGTLVTVAKDVKIQVDFNPAKVAGYRLIGYEDRRLANKDFDNDQKDAGEIGAGHRVTALYEVIPAGKWVGVNPPSESESSKYLQKPGTETKFETRTTGEYSSEVLTLKVRYKEPEGSVSTKQEFVLKDSDRGDRPLVDRDMQWATSVAEFGLLLRRSEMAPQASWVEMLERASSSAGGDAYRLECLAMMRKARNMFP